MKNYITALLLACTLCSSVAVAEPTIVLLPDGTAWYSAGPDQPTVLIKNIIRAPGMPPNGNVPPGGDEQPPSGSEVRTTARDLAKSVDDTVGATLMAKTYELLGEYVASGKIPSDPDSVDKALTEAADKTLEMMPAKKADQWEDAHQKLLNLLRQQLIASGGKLSKEQWSTFFRDASLGINDAIDNRAIPPYLEPLVAALVKVLIELLTNMF